MIILLFFIIVKFDGGVQFVEKELIKYFEIFKILIIDEKIGMV